MLNIHQALTDLFNDITRKITEPNAQFDAHTYEKRLQVLLGEVERKEREAYRKSETLAEENREFERQICEEHAEIDALKAKYAAALAEFDIPPMEESVDFTSMRKSFTDRISGRESEIQELKTELSAERESMRLFRSQTKEKILDLEQLLKNKEIGERALRCASPPGGSFSEAAEFVIADLEAQIIELKRKNTDLEIIINKQRFELAGLE